MATTTEIRNFSQEHGCSDAIALKVLSLQSKNTKLVGLVSRVRERILARAESGAGINAEQRAALHDIDAILRELGEAPQS